MLPSAWFYYQVVESPPNQSLQHVPWISNATHQDIQLNSGYYAMMQFSKYIRKGYTIIHVSDWDSVAAFDDTTKTLIIVTTNGRSVKVQKTFDLQTFSELGQLSVVRTSKTEPHVAVLPPTLVNSQLSFEFPPESITTFKIRNAVPTLADNLLRNADFEATSPASWQLLFGVRDDNGINANYPRKGNKSGFLDFTQSKLSLVQNITASHSRTFYLTAWCATTGNNTFLGILVNGLQGPEVNIVSLKGYQIYGLSLNVQSNDVLTIFLHSEQGNHTAQIDDVMFH